MRQRPAGGERATWKSGWRNHRGKGVTGGNVCALRTQAGVTGGGRGNRGFPGLLPVLCFSSSLKYLEISI